MTIVKFSRYIPSFYKIPATRFIVVGISNFLITFITYSSALLFFNFQVSYIMAVSAALIFTTFMNISHVFSKNLNLKRVVLYGLYYLFYSFCSYKVVELLIVEFKINAILSLLFTIAIITPIHFLFSRWLINFSVLGSPKRHNLKAK